MKFNKLLNEMGIKVPSSEWNSKSVLMSIELIIDNYKEDNMMSKPEHAKYVIGVKQYNYGDLARSPVTQKVIKVIMEKVWKVIPLNEKPKDVLITTDGIAIISPELGNATGNKIKIEFPKLGLSSADLVAMTAEITKIKSLMN